jgi:acyl carrier protein
MTPKPIPVPCPALARFPASVHQAYERYRATGDVAALEEVVIAATVDHRPGAKADAAAVTDATRLLQDLGYDSVSVAELVFFLEDLFDLSISTDDIKGVVTIGDLRACVLRKLAAKTRAA